VLEGMVGVKEGNDGDERGNGNNSGRRVARLVWSRMKIVRGGRGC